MTASLFFISLGWCVFLVGILCFTISATCLRKISLLRKMISCVYTACLMLIGIGLMVGGIAIR